MKRIFVFLLSASLLACNADDKKATTATASTDTHAAQAVSATDTAAFTTVQWLDSTTQNLGNLSKGQVVEISWSFKNTGDKPLVIQDVRPACGCTVADKPNEPIAPGGTGVIKAKYNSDGGAGHVSKQMTVMANLKNHNNGNDTQLGFTADVND